jgi:Putative Actinobacterial Holin-X, holin superfamily III
MPPLNHEERSLGELFAELSRETSALVRSEVTLAKTELTEKASRVGRDASMVAAGGAVAHAGALALVAGAVLILIRIGLEPWMAAVIVGVAVAAIGYGMTTKALTALKRDDLTPRHTIDSMKETAQWAKNQTR